MKHLHQIPLIQQVSNSTDMNIIVWRTGTGERLSTISAVRDMPRMGPWRNILGWPVAGVPWWQRIHRIPAFAVLHCIERKQEERYGFSQWPVWLYIKWSHKHHAVGQSYAFAKFRHLHFFLAFPCPRFGKTAMPRVTSTRCAKATPRQARVEYGLGFRKQWTMWALYGVRRTLRQRHSRWGWRWHGESLQWHLACYDNCSDTVTPVASEICGAPGFPAPIPRAKGKEPEPWGKTSVSVSTVCNDLCSHGSWRYMISWYHVSIILMLIIFQDGRESVYMCNHYTLVFDDWRHAFCLTAPLAELCSGIVVTPLMLVLSGFERSWWTAKMWLLSRLMLYIHVLHELWWNTVRDAKVTNVRFNSGASGGAQ